MAAGELSTTRSAEGVLLVRLAGQWCMTVNEEIDALQTMGISAMEYLVLPRMLALMLMMPLLTLYADIVGIFGGLLVGVGGLGLGVMQYVEQTREALTVSYFAAGLFKGSVYGVIVALAGCLRGMQCGVVTASVSDIATPVRGDDAGAIVTAMSVALGDLSREIATAIRQAASPRRH